VEEEEEEEILKETDLNGLKLELNVLELNVLEEDDKLYFIFF
jgi:hypothetical protein